jgi:hypothetical protein
MLFQWRFSALTIVLSNGEKAILLLDIVTSVNKYKIPEYTKIDQHE